MRSVGLLTQAFVIGLISLGAVLYLAFSVASRFADAPVPRAAHTVVFTVPTGASTADIGLGLQAEGLIRSDVLFRLLVDRRDLHGKLRQGRYLLREDMLLEEILDTLVHGTVVEQTVTFPEGWRLEQMADRLADQTTIDPADFARLANASAWQSEFELLGGLPPGTSLEGYLFPDTYRLTAATTAEDLIRRMLRRFDDVVGDDLRNAAAVSGLTLHEAVTLASIIEREAALDEERALISGVFHNRLARGIPLQADPTAQYAIGQTTPGGRWWKPDITDDDLRVPSPYNTYLHQGLPPGPIAGPGLPSIQAAVNPASTTYLFFVAAGDLSHAFSETSEEHDRNIRLYQR